jgi:hypothetical protein
MAELLKMTADAMAAKEAAARIEGGLVPLRQELSDAHSDRDAWRSEVERLILIEYRRNERERLPWWKRLDDSCDPFTVTSVQNGDFSKPQWELPRLCRGILTCFQLQSVPQ